MKILNLYAGLGGNRSLWAGHEVTAVEYDAEIAQIYQDRFPQDTVIVGDAHEYLAKHYAQFDFIWSSPPCQSHSSFRQNIGVRFRGVEPVYPDMSLYQEILFLQYNCKTKWVVENVRPYYKPLIEPSVELQRHYFWANFDISQQDFQNDKLRGAQIPDLQELHGIDLSGYKIANKRQILRNCVLKEVGEWVLRHAV
jgi:DNA (cytosine-5)-methyltransferase 1